MFRIARNLYRYRGLLATLTARELKARYRGSVLGYLWSLANPLLLLLVYTFVFSTVFDPRDDAVTPYGLFLAAGVFPWLWLSSGWLEGSGALIANSGLIRKAVFPAELLPVVAVLTNLVHFAVALPVIIGAIAVGASLGHPIGGWSAALVPLVVLVQLPMVAGLALGFAALNAHFKDVKDLLQNLLTLLFFLTPILYTLATLHRLAESSRLVAAVTAVVTLNPLTPFLQAYQETLFFGRAPAPGVWLAMGLISALVWAAGTWLFDRLSETLVEAV